MKQYKLIKEYPGSPELGTIVSLKINGDYGLENHPEFWGEIKNNNPYNLKVAEKDYEILSVISTGKQSIYSKGKKILYNKDYKFKEMYSNEFWSIHSVKRLSDGEIFTIGDIIKCEDCKGKITSLEIYDDDIYLTGIDNKMPFGYTLCNALDCFEIPQKIEHSKPLFTTEDGVNIFEGDTYVQLALTFKPVFISAIYTEIGRPNIFYDYNNLEQRKISNSNGRYYFSTKEAAEEYILMNKPCLSINDFLNSYYFEDNLKIFITDKLKKRVKSTL